ncbi:MAG: FIMAH domain-containing protein [Planctomycetota bacterium]|jgi:beta propeller repeat protein
MMTKAKLLCCSALVLLLCAVAYALEFTETRITDDSAEQIVPDVSGDRIVWVDRRNGAYDDIYSYVVSTGIETRITPHASVRRTSPAISGDKVVWVEGFRNETIRLFDFATNTTRTIASGAYHIGPRISGDRVVWADYRALQYDVYVYDLTTDVETRITDEAADQVWPDICGDRVVWHDARNGRPDIYLCDLSTGVETRITDDPNYNQWYPRISGDRIVWQDARNGWSLYMHDLATGTETLISDASGSVLAPTISGDQIVWTDFRNSQWDLFLYDLATGAETQLTNDAAAQGVPAIWGNRIVFHDDRYGNRDIFLIEIAGSVPTIDAILDQYVADGSISNRGIAEALQSLLHQAAAALDRGNGKAAANTLRAFQNLVEGQSGKHIDSDAAEVLIDMAQAVIDDL